MFPVGQTIKRIREERGMSQHELATQTGLTASYLSLLENGRRSPSLNALSLLADSLNVPVSVLIWDAVDIPESLTPKDRRICETAKMIVRRYLECENAQATP